MSIAGWPVIAAVAISFAGHNVQAQWLWDRGAQVAANSGQTLIVGVGCSGSDPVFSVRFVDDDRFRTGMAIALFDDGDPLDMQMVNRGQQLNGTLSDSFGRNFLRLLRRARTLTLAVARAGQEQPAVDTISLRGSDTAIRSLDCQ